MFVDLLDSLMESGGPATCLKPLDVDAASVGQCEACQPDNAAQQEGINSLLSQLVPHQATVFWQDDSKVIQHDFTAGQATPTE